jgi:hypothetical protein
MPTLRAVKSWYSAERGGFITLQDDVLGIVSQIRRLYGDKITVELDDERGVFHFVGHENGEDYLVFTVSELDQRALDRLLQADSQQRGFRDSYDEVERAQDVLDRAKEQAMRESIGVRSFCSTSRRKAMRLTSASRSTCLEVS